jgi:hypothetical protein
MAYLRAIRQDLARTELANAGRRGSSVHGRKFRWLCPPRTICKGLSGAFRRIAFAVFHRGSVGQFR